jgi:hypothetical protein
MASKTDTSPGTKLAGIFKGLWQATEEEVARLESAVAVRDQVLATVITNLRHGVSVPDVLKWWDDEGRAMVQRHPAAMAQGALLEALNCRSLFANPDAMRTAADEIDCCGGPMRCETAWHEWDTNASGCRASERGEYCPNDVAETLRALANVAEGKKP